MRRMDRMGCSGTMGVGEGMGERLEVRKEASMIMHVLQG